MVVLLILASGVIVQIAQGFHHFEFGLYFRELFLNRLTQLWILCVLAMFVQTIVNNKYLGHFVMVLYIVATIVAAAGGFSGLSLPLRPDAVRSRTPTSTATARSCSRSSGSGCTGSIAAILLAIVTNLLWVRGTESSWRVRLKLAAARFSGRVAGRRNVCVWC